MARREAKMTDNNRDPESTKRGGVAAMEPEGISRRGFLKNTAAALGGLTALEGLANVPAEADTHGKLTFGLITTHSDWCHWENLAWGQEGVQYIVDRYVEAGIQRLCWRCTDGGTALYWSKMREPFHGLDTDCCHATYFMTPDLGRYWRTDYHTFDSFAAAVELGHKAGLEVYAWCQMAGEDDCFGYKSRRVKEHPEFCTVGRNGKRFAAKLGWAYPENHEYLIGLLREVLAYRPDGVILDFQKNQGDFRDQRTDDAGYVYYGYESPAVDDFRRKTGRDPFKIPNSDPEWIQHRANYVTEFVRKARAVQKEVAPNVRWVGQVWAGGGNGYLQLAPEETYKRGGSYWVNHQFPVKNNLAGNLEDVGAWTESGAFDLIYPLYSPGNFPGGLPAVMKTLHQLKRGHATRIEAGTYVWDQSADTVRQNLKEAVDAGASEMFLLESEAFQMKPSKGCIDCPPRRITWEEIRDIVKQFGG